MKHMQFCPGLADMLRPPALSQTFQHHTSSSYVDQAPIVDVYEVVMAAKHQPTEARCQEKIFSFEAYRSNIENEKHITS
jgi:hypothetical protein